MYCNNLLKQLLKDDSTKDFSISAQDGNSIRVHKAIFVAKCTNAREETEALESGTISTNTENVHSLELLVEFLYTGMCSLDAYSIVDVMCLGFELGFAELVKATTSVISNELKLLNPSTAFIIFDNILRKIKDVEARADPTPNMTKEVQLCQNFVDPVLDYIARNAYDVFMQTIPNITMNKISPTVETIRAILTYPYLSCGEAHILSLIDAWAGCEGFQGDDEVLREFYGLIDLERVTVNTLMKYKDNKYIPKERYVHVLEHLSAKQKCTADTKHRDHGRFAIGHCMQSYPGYRVVETLDEFVEFFPELLRQRENENVGIPMLGSFTVTRSSLGIRDGLVAVGWDPRAVFIKSDTVDFFKVGEHKGEYADLVVSGYSSLLSVPTARRSWSVNPKFISFYSSSTNMNDRPGLFVRKTKEEEKKDEEEKKKEEKKKEEEKVIEEKEEKKEEVKIIEEKKEEKVTEEKEEKKVIEEKKEEKEE